LLRSVSVYEGGPYMGRTEETPISDTQDPSVPDAMLDKALEESFPASDPIATEYGPRGPSPARAFASQGAAARRARTDLAGSDEALVAYLTLALRGSVEEVELSTLSIRKAPAFLLARKFAAELDSRARGDIPSPLDCHCGSPTCSGCDEGEDLLSRISALDIRVRPCSDCGSTDPAHCTPCGIRRPMAPAIRPKRWLSNDRIVELISEMDAFGSGVSARGELFRALRELLAWRGVRS
jgi:hypothetical protein